MCDFYHQGRSYCPKGDCKIAEVISNHRCYKENNKNNKTDQEKRKYGTKFGANTRCFNSNLVNSR